MSSRPESLPDLERDMHLDREAIAAMREAWLNPPRLTWDQYVKAVDEFTRQYPPNRDVQKWDEPFEI